MDENSYVTLKSMVANILEKKYTIFSYTKHTMGSEKKWPPNQEGLQ